MNACLAVELGVREEERALLVPGEGEFSADQMLQFQGGGLVAVENGCASQIIDREVFMRQCSIRICDGDHLREATQPTWKPVKLASRWDVPSVFLC